MKNRCTLNFFLMATLLSMSVLTADIPFVRAIEWSSETQLTIHSKQDMSPSIMQADDGTIWVVWVSNRMGLGNDELFYKTSSDYGLNWSLDTRLTQAPGYDASPSIVQASNGTVWVVWSSYRTGNYELFYKTFNGSSWSSDIQLTIEPNQDKGPSITQATNGFIWVVWFSNRTGNYELFHKTYNGSAWSTETQLTYNDSILDQYPSIVQASNGTVWVVWSSYRTGNYELFYKTFNGSSWSSDTQLTDDPDSDMAPSIAQARDGTIWVVWESDRPQGTQDELYYKIYNGSAWSPDTQLTDDPAYDIAPSIAQIDDRKIWVMWTANRDDDFDVYYKTSSQIIIYDVAITNVTPSATRVDLGESVYISVVVENQGDENETFDVNCYANTITIGFTTITLANRTFTTLIFSWNTSDVNIGNYTIRAEASIVSGEIDTVDNIYIYGMVMVTIPGDVNGDGIVNITDIALVGEVYGTAEGDSDYNPNADLNDDEVVDIYDLAECGKNYGETGF